jgi:energy-coupling factor transport system substrate-specific component
MGLDKVRGLDRLFLVLGATLLGGLLNALLSVANMAIASPFFFDSIFTAVVAALFGPLAGMATALVSHVFMELFHDWNGQFMPFVVCNVATGLIVGFFARSGGLRKPTGAMLAALAVTLANALFGAVVAYYVFGGITGHASDYLVTGFIIAGQSLLSASFWARIPANLIDKGLAVAAAMAVARIWTPRRDFSAPLA